jgi:hypothetical protein
MINTNENQLLLLNFGAGDPVPGWLNVDSSPFYLLPRIIHRIISTIRLSSRSDFFLRADYRFHLFSPNRRLPFKDRTFDIVYCSHVIEHLPAESLGHLIDEFHRVLKYNGVARVIIPDLETAILSCLAEGRQGPIDIGEHLGTLPRALRSSPLRMMVEALFGFPSLHKTLVASKYLDDFPGVGSKWHMKQGLHFMESDIRIELLKTIETESRCKGSLVFELRKKEN